MSCVRFSVAKQNKSRLETRARSHVTADSTGRPGHVGDHIGPYGPQKRRGDVERDARRFRPTRSPAPPDTSAAGSGRRTGPATTGGTLPSRPAR